MVEQDARRTGAGVLVKSGAVRYDPLLRVKFVQAGFEIHQWNVERARDVGNCIGRAAAHINEDRRLGIKGSFGFLEGDAWDLGIGICTEPTRGGRQRGGAAGEVLLEELWGELADVFLRRVHRGGLAGGVLRKEQSRGNDTQQAAHE